jgi:tetratricopeptide (TPR) repeat protein
MIKTVAYYIYVTVFPYRLAFFRKFGEEYVKDEVIRKDMESLNKWFWISVAGILAFIGIGWKFSPLGVVWFLCCIAPFSQFKVLGQFVAERYIYLPAIGWYLILGAAITPYPILAIAILALYALRTHLYIPTYKCIESLYEEGIKNEPRCLANYANLGERYIHMGRLLEGREVLQKGLDLDPDNFLCYTNTAAYWVQVRDIKKALYYTNKAIEQGHKKSSWMIVHAMMDQWRNLTAFEQRYLDELDNRRGTPNVVGAI